MTALPCDSGCRITGSRGGPVAQRGIIGLVVGWALPVLMGVRAQQRNPQTAIGDHQATPPAKRASNIRIDSNLVLVPVSVCDPMNRPVTGLEKEHFKIFDDKVEQTVT